MNRYRVLLPVRLAPREFQPTEPGEPSPSWKQGDEFDHELSVEDEAANLASGLIEIVPRLYRVVGTSEVLGHVASDPPFEAAIPKGQEELLLGYHIERVDSKPTAKSKADKG